MKGVITMAETKEIKEVVEEKEEKKKPIYDFKKLTAEDMAKYIEEYHNDAESKKKFKEALCLIHMMSSLQIRNQFLINVLKWVNNKIKEEHVNYIS